MILYPAENGLMIAKQAEQHPRMHSAHMSVAITEVGLARNENVG